MSVILLADDNPNIREYCRHELEDEGYRVLIARNGREVLRLTDHVRPDLIILDVCMGEVDGLEAVTRIRSTQPDVPIVLHTSFDDICTRDARSWQATACVEKRSDLTELKHVVAAALTSQRHKRPYRLGLPPTSVLAT
jgi:CheY-like chemotaxis protein